MLNVGVLFRNNEALVQPFFYFLRRATGIPIRVIALDNASEDRTGEEINKQLDFNNGDIKLITSENIGISRARNRIVKFLKGETGKYQDLCLLDSDVFICVEGSLDKMYSMLKVDKKIGMTFGDTFAFNDFEKRSLGMCFGIIKAEIFEKLGIFDEQFWCWYDDTDLMHKARLLNYELKVIPEAKAIHAWGSTLSYGSEGKFRAERIEEDRQRFNKKWNVDIGRS
jgi:GT2 family glycosyltransferase